MVYIMSHATTVQLGLLVVKHKVHSYYEPPVTNLRCSTNLVEKKVPQYHFFPHRTGMHWFLGMPGVIIILDGGGFFAFTH